MCLYKYMHMKSKKENIMIIRVTEEEKKIAQKLRKEHAINISSLLRNHLRTYYKEISNSKQPFKK